MCLWSDVLKQSPNDLKQYSSITLANGLRVLLVQNDETQKSAAALAVNVGHFSDPNNRQGLAHFLEHMLFLGTKLYPDGSEYQQFISQYGGSNNAWTATEHTCFFFDIDHQQFEPALDRFSQFFISPLLSAEYVNKERKNIDAEFKLKLKDDIRRLYDVHKETINPAHPFAKFSVGNTETLADRPDENLRDTLLDFFNKHYVAGAMTLVVEGPQSLNQLKQWVTAKFSAIAEAKTIAPIDNVPLYLPEHLQISIQVKPVKDDRQLIICFAMPSIDHFYRSKPESLLAYLIGHEGKNSLLSFLKHKQWALGLIAGTGINGYNFKDFNISIPLTELGAMHTEDIITAVFSYIGLLKAKPLAEFYYLEKRSIAELSFYYHEKVRPLDSVGQLAINMQHYPSEDYIFGDYVMDGATNQQIDQLLSYLTATNMRVITLDHNCIPSKISHWYQVPYKVSKIKPGLIDKWQTYQPNGAMALPKRNHYIVDKPVVFALSAVPENTKHKSSTDHTKDSVADAQQGKMVNTLPQRIEHSSGFSVWFKQDHTFKVPKGYIYINIDSPVTIKNNCQIAMTRLFVDLFSDAVIERHYDAELAGIHYHLYPHQGGMTLQLSGISDKQELLLTELLDELNEFHCDESQFILLKKQLLTHWHNADNSKAITQLFSKLSSAIQPKNPCAEQLIAALTPVTFVQFKQYCQQILQKIAIEVFIHGNWRAQEAEQLTAIIKSAFIDKYSSDFAVKVPILDIQGQGNITLPLHLNDQDNATVIYYPMANREPDLVAKTMIISQFLSPIFFKKMRTEKQYGYLVGVSYVPINRYPGIAFYIQSPHVEAKSLTQAIDHFINQCHLILIDMDQQAWLDLQQGLAGQLEEKDTSLRIRSQRFWASICNKELHFSGKKQLTDTILSLSKADVIQFITEIINKNTVSEGNITDRFNLETVQQPITHNTVTSKNQNIQTYEKIINLLVNTCSTKF